MYFCVMGKMLIHFLENVKVEYDARQTGDQNKIPAEADPGPAAGRKAL
jgi:hypothetical protein